ncbi:MAG: Rieske (2Fe-2S) protein [Desulfomonile sp.]
MNKRSFLKYGLLSLSSAVVAMGTWGIAKFVFFDSGRKKRREFSKEVLSRLQPDVPMHLPEAGAWLVKRRDDDQITAFDDRCPHLGCRENWNSERMLFECPCHGSEFDLEGNVRRGPASRPMMRLYMIGEDGNKLRLHDKPPSS